MGQPVLDMLTEAERKAIRKYADKYKKPLP